MLSETVQRCPLPRLPTCSATPASPPPPKTPALQHDALTAAGCYRVWTDTAFGTLTACPAFDDVLERLGPGDKLVVWRLDRLARSLGHLLQLIDELTSRGVGFRSLTESVDTTTATGRLVLHLFGALGDRRQARGRGRPRATWRSASCGDSGHAGRCPSAADRRVAPCGHNRRRGRCLTGHAVPSPEPSTLVFQARDRMRPRPGRPDGQVYRDDVVRQW